MRTLLLTLLLAIMPLTAYALAGNTAISSYPQARKLLRDIVYRDFKRTLYCDATFDTDGTMFLPAGFTTPSHQPRARRMEVEHSVPAENFGRFFPEWRNGHPQCVNAQGKAFKGRKCAAKVNPAFRRMEADLYNLFPVIGAVNAIRSNHKYAVLPDEASTFGACPMKVHDRKAEPPDWAKGQVARAGLYFDAAYGGEHFRLSRQQRRLFEAWDRQFPVSWWECERARRIEEVQGNEQPYVKRRCFERSLW